VARVPQPYQVVFDSAARQDLKDIFDYINNRAGPTIAERFTARLHQYCTGLSHTPERGTRRDELRPGLRTIGYRRRATVVFRIDRSERTVAILGIYYGGRNYADDFADSDD
jgi:toxin ParE1/3/4